MVVSHIDVSSRAVVVVVVVVEMVVEMVVVVIVHWWVPSGLGPWLVSSDLAVSSNPVALGIEASHRSS
jgi:hypothetical protein